jgi:hypothetical protein
LVFNGEDAASGLSSTCFRLDTATAVCPRTREQWVRAAAHRQAAAWLCYSLATVPD